MAMAATCPIISARNSHARVTVGASTSMATIVSRLVRSSATIRQNFNVAISSLRSASSIRKQKVAPPNATAAWKSTNWVSQVARKHAAAHSPAMSSNQFCKAARTADVCRSRTVIESPTNPEAIAVANTITP